MPPATDEPIALQLRDHQTGLTDWPLAPLVQEFHRWIAVFDSEFKLQLPSYPVIYIAQIKRSAYASYAWFRSALGTKDNITFNIRYFDRPANELLATLLHELLHLWQHYSGSPSRSSYHNREYCNKAAACGLIVTPEGCNVGFSRTFLEVIERHGVRADALVVDLGKTGMARKQLTKMKKWTCHCTIVRCATDLRASCLHCGRQFERQ